jgi:hypothetical protein
MKIVSSLPQVNYVALSPMSSTTNENLSLYTQSLMTQILVVDMVISSVGILELDLLTPIANPRHVFLPECVSSFK